MRKAAPEDEPIRRERGEVRHAPTPCRFEWDRCARQPGTTWTLSARAGDYPPGQWRRVAFSARGWAKRRGLKVRVRYNARKDLVLVTFGDEAKASYASKWAEAAASSAWIKCEINERERAMRRAAEYGLRAVFHGSKCRFIPDVPAPGAVVPTVETPAPFGV